VQAGTAADTAFVSVVPEATLAANTGTAIVSFKTDGTAITTLAPTTQRSLTTDWSPDGAEVVYDEEYVGQLRVVNVASKNVRVASSGGAIYGRFAADGQTLYYSQQSWRLRRQRRDGTGDELVPMTSPVSDVYAAPSPDGARVAYVTTFGFGSDELKMLTLATGASTSLGIAGHSPNWSPTGALIAFVDASTAELKLVNPDGTNVRVISPAGRYQRGIDWSPDGRWIAAWNVATNRIDLIDTQSTLVLPLGFTLGWTAPSWKP
jgi:Tol biopolymer transport system component